MSQVLKSMDDLNIDWINDVLRKKFADDLSVQNFEVKIVQSTMSTIAFVDLTYRAKKDIYPDSLFFKFAKLNPDGTPTGSGTKEVHFYNNLTGVIKEQVVPKCYFAQYDFETNFYTIVLDNIANTHGNAEWPANYFFEQCCLAIDSLAEIHAAWWDHPDLERIVPKRTHEDCERIRLRYRQLAKTFFAENDQVIKKEYQDIFFDFESKYPIVDQRFLSYKNISLVHRDAHFWNFMYPKNRVGSVLMIDWDSWRIDVPTNDVAYYMAVHWGPDRRKRYEISLLERYFNRLLACGVQNYSYEMLLNDYKISVLSALYLAPVQYKMGLDEYIWLANLECTCWALDDLNCKDVFLP